MSENAQKPRIRFKGFSDAWEQRKLGDLFNYYRPDNYIVKSDKYVENAPTPVLTANKGFILGYTSENRTFSQPCIIFDDFTLDNKFVDFPFMVKSSAMKILVLKDEKFDDLIFCYELLNSTKIEVLGHARHYISVVQPTVVNIPRYEEQRRISELFQQISNLITLHQRKYDKLVAVKKSLLEKMFPADGETVPKIRFKGFSDAWEQRKFEDAFIERREKTVTENEDTLLSCAINGMFLNSELFGHFRGTTTIGYLKVKKNDLILSAQNLHLGNANVNLRFEHGIISPAYKVYDLNNCEPEFVQAWVKKEDTKNFFLAATTEGASQCRKNIEWDTLGKQTICMPAIKEQATIGSFFKCVDNLITLHQRQLEKLKNIKSALLEKMFV